MKLPRRQLLHLAAGAAALSTVSRFAWAQAYPSRPVRIIAATGPGGAPDIYARLMGQWLSERLGQPFVTENRPGGGHTIGTEALVRAAPDGYTLLLVEPTASINATLYEKLNYNFIRDIAPVAGIVLLPLVISVHPSVPAKTIPELIAYAKANPGKVNMASPGIATPGHVAGELFKMMTGVDMVHVPYRGGGPAMIGLLAGDVDVFISDLSTTIENIRGGRIKALAMAWPSRSPFLPETPTFAELGYPAVVSSSWFGLATPVNTPVEIIERLALAAKQANASPEYLTSLKKLGNEPFALTPEQSAAFIKTEIDKWAAVARSANIQID
jgi:tripartite-type tricarboxylate transporter receptor subunit TctC